MAGTSRKRQDAEAEYTKKSAVKSSRGSGSSKSRQASGTSSGKKADASRTSKQGSSKQSASKKRREAEPEAASDSFIGAEVAVIVAFAVSVLLFLSNFGLCGAVGDFLRQVMLGIFGSVGYLAPILLFVGVCFHMSNRGNVRATVKMAAVLLLLLALCGLDQMIFGGGLQKEWKLLDYYKQSGADGDGGGLVGGLLVVLLGNSVGTVGTYLVLLAGMVIGAVCITEKSLVNLVKRGSGRAYEYAREDMNRRRELHEERREEKRRLRQEQRVRGVDLDATNLHGVPLMREFAAGIPEGTVLGSEGTALEPDKNVLKPAEAPGGQAPLPGDVPAGVWDGKEAAQEENGTASSSSGAAPRMSGAASGENPADVFRGRIQMPYEPEGQEAETQESGVKGSGSVDSTSEKSASEKTGAAFHSALETGAETRAQAGADAASISEPGVMVEKPSLQARQEQAWKEPSDQDPSDADQLLKEIYVRRETRTFGEISGEEPAGMGSREFARSVVDDVIAGAADLQPEEEAALPEAAEDVWEDAWPEDPEYPAEAFDEVLPSQSEPGVRKGDFFIPEEAKTVVTASGKVIETDTELVRKTLEKKREERKNLPDSELTVSEQIERKEESQKAVRKEYIFPPLDLLKKGTGPRNGFSEQEYKATAIKLQQTLQNFGVGVTVTNISCGPSVTRYELHPEQGVKVSKIVSLADDIKLNLAAADIRIEAPIPGKAAVGIEVPNKENTTVFLRDLLESEEFKRHSSRVAFAVGKDIAGQVVVSDIAKMPHLLIAGATGSGKSVCINTLIMSVIYKARPEDVKLIMIDPKVVELSVYNGIPHLLIPVVTDAKKASGALNWAVAEMMDRYGRFAKYNVRDLKGYNEKVESIRDIDDDKKPEKLPQIIIIVDELADLMMVAPGEVEDAICRLAQLARAAGIHLVIATQRPSVNVITGVIKANIPSRIAFSVSSGVDSRTIIDMNGAEKLLGKGDMLFYPSGYQKPQRVQGAFVSDKEVSRVVEFLSEQGMTADYSSEVESKIGNAVPGEGASSGGERDAYFEQAGRFIIEKDKASIGMLQRMFKIGFNRAARIMDQLAEAGVVGEEEGTKPRKILMTMEEFEEYTHA